MKPITLSIPTGREVKFPLVGNYLRLKSSAVPIHAKSRQNDEEFIFEDAGDDVIFTPFTSMWLSHDDAADQEIVLYVGTNTKASSSKIGGNVQISGITDPLTPPTLEGTGYYRWSASSLLFTVLSPAANVNGCILKVGIAMAQQGTLLRLMAKSSAPLAYTDPLALTLAVSQGIGTYDADQSESQSFYIPPGVGIFEQASDATNITGCSVVYKLL